MKAQGKQPQKQKAAASSPAKKNNSVKKQNDRVSGKEEEVDVLRARVKYLETENGKLIAEKEIMAKRVEEVKRSIEHKLKEIQEGISQKLDRGDSKSSIMEYVKAGFGAMLGALAALLVVNLAIDAFDSLVTPDQDASATPPAAEDDITAGENAGNASSTVAEYGNNNVMASDDMFSMFGGSRNKGDGGRSKKNGKPSITSGKNKRK